MYHPYKRCYVIEVVVEVMIAMKNFILFCGEFDSSLRDDLAYKLCGFLNYNCSSLSCE